MLVVAVVVSGLLLLSQYMYVLPIHIAAFFFSITFVVISDVHAGLWVWGKLPTLPQRRMLWLHRIVSLGLLVAAVSGVLLAWPVLDYLLATPAFIGKLIFVGALVINGVVIGRHLDLATERSFAELTTAERTPLFISGAVSTVSWIGAFILAGFLGL